MRELFPFGSLKSGDFEYCGKQVRTVKNTEGVIQEIRVGQKGFVEARLDLVDIERSAIREKNEFGEEMATPGEVHDHRSAVGGLGWLSAQVETGLGLRNLPSAAETEQTHSGRYQSSQQSYPNCKEHC